jgi:two-component system, response regulator PdtaR
MPTATADTQSVVLLVEDDSLVRMLGADVLEDAGFEVIEAADADQGIALLKRHHDVRVLWTDVDMPGSLNGFELARFVSQGWPDVAVVVTSGKLTPGPGDLPRRGAFIPKPYRPEAVIRCIQEMTQPG